jgi:hypothetical protein
MAAASYTTDLVDIYTDTSGGGFTLISSGGGGQNALTDPETDDYIQGTSSISRNPWSGAIRGMVFSSAQTIAAGNAVFIWTKADIAQALSSKAAGGIQALIGSGTGALKAYYVEGNDTYQFGGWKCYPIDPTVTQSASIGSPTATTNTFGVRWDVPGSGPSKGFPFKIDAIRRGRTVTATLGDLGNGYATFAALATFQGNITRQWGLFQFQNGTYIQQGRFQFGTGATLVDFRDSNRTIFIANTEYVGAAFNSFEVNNASSVVQLTGISISALGTVSRGTFTINNNASVTLTSCAFNDMSTFSLGGSNTSVVDSSFNRCNTVTLNGSTVTDSNFNRSTATTAVSATTLANLTGCTFTKPTTTSHAVTLTSIGGGSMTWNNTAIGYVSGVSGSPVTPGVTGNETIYVNVGAGTLTINVEAGATIPSIRSAGATVNVVAGQVTTTITVRDLLTGSPIQNANVYLTASAGGPLTEGTEIIKGLTDAAGQISDIRGLASNQPVTGWVRKATGSPLYQQGAIAGTINSATGLSVTVQMIRDE